jgi:hypothetical protein
MFFTGGLCGIMTTIDFLVLCFGDFTDADGNSLANKSIIFVVLLFILYFASAIIIFILVSSFLAATF